MTASFRTLRRYLNDIGRPSSAEEPTLVERFVVLCRRNPVVVDAVLAALLIGIAVSWTFEGKVMASQRTAALVVAVLAAAPVVFRRAYPIPAAVATAVVATVCTVALPGTLAAFLLPALVMGYSAVAYGPRWAGPVAVLLLLAGMFGPFLLRGAVPQMGLLGMAVVGGYMLLVAIGVWLTGSLRRASFRHTEGLRDRARLLEESRRQEVRIELLAERSRISREVHDVVAHSLSGIIAQADGGQFAAQRDPQKAVDVLAGIADTGREALADVRGLLEMLRDTGPDDPADSTADTAGRPQPGTDDVPALVEQVRAGGLPVDLEVTGTPRTVPTGPGLTAYRVVQEALTNVIKHAGPGTPTHVRLEWSTDELAVRVRDEGARGPVPRPPRGGHGLTGMRERAALHGGSVETGPHPDGGWSVRLRLPVPPSTPTRGER
ncbi:two-component system sensor kinase [Pseudonocardia sp. Ae168_Ps1]|uniref:sensor histidine kinase n=1 Tax=unclassified Pseudonocardia TaxID=2619320 RepID=UPI0009610CEB|nr:MULTISPECIES: sensor histidine kinase [unclassified Pseudonocardia]OLL71409.1 two-component system sensor kinase [Pseudonocardia sp. Ae168_Ps1]OLL77044.1 two-component system sensor kinase [Pseudonocardia sp. Ae150A_Ps1]OLL88845.1 two-component system sensor kinase [Pseudonocardia sp. Ae263_Ps1]OLL91129.1 two-component system sensor kinase [Pseudonocardia sp. Ae356_Ps1]